MSTSSTSNRSVELAGIFPPTSWPPYPSAGGISHHPDEFTEPGDLERGVRVLAGTLARLAE